MTDAELEEMLLRVANTLVLSDLFGGSTLGAPPLPVVVAIVRISRSTPDEGPVQKPGDDIQNV